MYQNTNRNLSIQQKNILTMPASSKIPKQFSWQCLKRVEMPLCCLSPLPTPFLLSLSYLFFFTFLYWMKEKGFRVLEIKFSNSYYFSPTAPKREGSRGKHLPYMNSAQPGRWTQSRFSQLPSASVWTNPDNQVSCVLTPVFAQLTHSSSVSDLQTWILTEY